MNGCSENNDFGSDVPASPVVQAGIVPLEAPLTANVENDEDNTGSISSRDAGIIVDMFASPSQIKANHNVLAIATYPPMSPTAGVVPYEARITAMDTDNIGQNDDICATLPATDAFPILQMQYSQNKSSAVYPPMSLTAATLPPEARSATSTFETSTALGIPASSQYQDEQCTPQIMTAEAAAYPPLSPGPIGSVPAEAHLIDIPTKDDLSLLAADSSAATAITAVACTSLNSMTLTPEQKTMNGDTNEKSKVIDRSNTSPSTSVTVACDVSFSVRTPSVCGGQDGFNDEDEFEENDSKYWANYRRQRQLTRRRKCSFFIGLLFGVAGLMAFWISLGDWSQGLRGNIHYIDETYAPTGVPVPADESFTYIKRLPGPKIQGCKGRVTRKLVKPIVANRIRLEIVSFYNWPSLQIGLKDRRGDPIPIVSISSSSSVDDFTCAPSNAVIKDLVASSNCENDNRSWCSGKAESGEYIDFTFNDFIEVSYIVMQGRSRGKQWGFVEEVELSAILATPDPTHSPTGSPVTSSPTGAPTTARPTLTPQPTFSPTAPQPTSSPTVTGYANRYVPGELSQMKDGILLSTGLDLRIIARKFQPVQLANGAVSVDTFHDRPDYGATFAVSQNSTENPGGWIYTSNSELEANSGGVGSIHFNARGETIKYEMLQKGTERNCGGGKTPWNTYISCEEPRIGRVGQCYEIDPTGKIGPRKTVLGRKGGIFESFSYDIRNKDRPEFFVTEDYEYGALRRFIPYNVNWEDPSNMLHGKGSFHYLVLKPNAENKGGAFDWVPDRGLAEQSAFRHYRNTEGIDADGRGNLYFVSKRFKMLYILDLNEGTYTQQSTEGGHFDGDPDQMTRLIDDDHNELVYFTENGGEDAGIHGRAADGRYFTILESPIYKEETTGLAFSPDYMHMYLAYQMNGLLFDVWRKDGQPFTGKAFNLQYHKVDLDSTS